MNESTLIQLKILVERAVRPVRASTHIKRQMREELLAHVTTVFQEEVARLANEQAALERTAQRFGNPAELTGQLQESIPRFDSIRRFAEWVSFRPGESILRRAVRYTILFEAAGLLLYLLFFPILLLQLGKWTTEALWQTYPELLIIGYMGFNICILESSLRRSLCEQKRSSWIQFTFVLVGSASVYMTLGLLAWGVSLTNTFWVCFITAIAPGVVVWRLAPDFLARKRHHEEWASLQIE
jgi:hypothetical protein